MLDSERLAIAAHLHVMLRRMTGRVTDTEWMATNVDHAAEIARFAREKSTEDGHAELAEWADKLEQAVQASPAVNRPIAQRALLALRAGSMPPEATHPASTAPGTGSKEPSPGTDALAPRYVGGIR
jgi:hypothetical protein